MAQVLQLLSALTEGASRLKCGNDIADWRRILVRKRDLHVIERNLRKMRSRLLENLQRIEQENIRVPPRVANGDPRGSGSEMADLAQEHFERENSLELYLYEHNLLKAIDEALARIKIGSYGVCAVCSSPINPRRLLAVPNANLCIHCQQEKERNGFSKIPPVKAQ